MKNILINISNTSRKYGGIYQYSLTLLNLVSTNLKNYNFYIFCYNPGDDVKKIVAAHSNIKFVEIENANISKNEKLILRILNLIYKITGFSRKIYRKDIYDKIIDKYKIDIIHTPFQDSIRKPRVKSITTIHDVQELHYPEFFTSAERAYRAVNYKKYIDEADAVVVSYNHIKEDIIKFFDKPAEKIHVILLDMTSLWFNQITSLSNVHQRFEIPIKYLLYPASTWEHKNHLRLLQAIKKIQLNDIFLVCTGNKTDYYNKIIAPYLEENNLNGKVKFLGIVSDEELYSLYNKCMAVVVPTLYEAGSFPLMESILMDIPVICSNVTSLPETINDKRFVFDPLDIEDIIDKIVKIWSDADYREKNRDTLKKQAKFLKNNKAEVNLESLYKDLE